MMCTRRVISATDGNLPNKPCQTCKNSFHASCLYEVRALSKVYLVFPDRRPANGGPPVFSGSRAATRLAALYVVPTLLDRRRTGGETRDKWTCVYCIVKCPLPSRRPYHVLLIVIVFF